MPDDTFVADVLLSSTENGDPRINIGENTDGLGFGADTALWANGDGFLAIPNPPSDEGAAQVVAIQDGNTKRAIASRDNRFAGNAGDLQPGDRAIVSDCEAFLKLTQASDKIALASGGNMSVEVDSTGNVVMLRAGAASVGLSRTNGNILLETGIVQILLQSASITLSVGPTTILISATGVAIIAPPGPLPPPSPQAGITFNAAAMIVP